MRNLVVAGFVVLVAFAGTALAGGFDPKNFEVDLKGSPNAGEPPQPECKSVGEVHVCKGSYSITLAAQAMKGTVKDKESGKSGSIETSCDYSMSASFSMRASQESVENSMSSSGSQRCSWFMDFGGGSTLTGLLDGSMKMAVENGKGSMSGKTVVTVTAGTGDFAGKVGSGVFEQNEQINLPMPSKPPAPSQPPGGQPPGGQPPGGQPPGGQPPGGQPPSQPPGGQPPGGQPPGGQPPSQPPGGQPPGGQPPSQPPGGQPPGQPPSQPPGDQPPPGQPPSQPPGDQPPPSQPPPTSTPPGAFAFRSLALAAAAPKSQMRLKLRAGRPIAAIASPERKLNAKSDGGLRVVSAPGATCSARAQQGAEQVDLGSAADSDRDGLVIVTAKLRPKLGKGTWRLAATCSYSGGSAKATSTVKVS